MIGGLNDLTIVDNGNVELSYEKKRTLYLRQNSILPKEWLFTLKSKFTIDNDNLSVQDEPEPWWTAISQFCLDWLVSHLFLQMFFFTNIGVNTNFFQSLFLRSIPKLPLTNN